MDLNILSRDTIAKDLNKLAASSTSGSSRLSSQQRQEALREEEGEGGEGEGEGEGEGDRDQKTKGKKGKRKEGGKRSKVKGKDGSTRGGIAPTLRDPSELEEDDGYDDYYNLGGEEQFDDSSSQSGRELENQNRATAKSQGLGHSHSQRQGMASSVSTPTLATLDEDVDEDGGGEEDFGPGGSFAKNGQLQEQNDSESYGNNSANSSNKIKGSSYVDGSPVKSALKPVSASGTYPGRNKQTQGQTQGKGKDKGQGQGQGQGKPQIKSSISVDNLASLTERLSREDSWLHVSSITKQDRDILHYEDAWACATRNFGKGFVLGAGGTTFVNAFYFLLQLVRGRKQTLSVDLFVQGSRDMGLFLGSLLATHNTAMFLTRTVPNPTFRRYRGVFSGALAGPSMFFLPEHRRFPVVLFMLVRSMELGARIAANRKLIPSFEHGDTALMSTASSIMIWLWLNAEEALDQGYRNFLQTQVQLPREAVRATAAMLRGDPIPNFEAYNKARAKMSNGKATPLKTAVDYMETANPSAFILHPTMSYFKFVVRYFVNGLRLAFPVYLPVYGLPLLLFSRHRLVSEPVSTIAGTMKGVLRSTLFLAVYCTFGIASLPIWRAIGFNPSILGRFSHLAGACSGALAGIATLIEKKGRRIELGLYVMSKALEGVWEFLKMKGAKPVKNGEVFLMSLCMGLVMHAYTRHPSLIRPMYRALMERFFDNDERHKIFAGIV